MFNKTKPAATVPATAETPVAEGADAPEEIAFENWRLENTP